MITTQKAIRAAFWSAHPGLTRRTIRDYAGTGRMYPVDTRCAFADFVDYLHRAGQISDCLADRATL
tara:strand:+ start:3400 stop:3597 length:198 start_codon:yes stop_codon:yes gene_type:complete